MISVLHLVRYTNDISLFKNFLESYKKYQSGIEHRLVIIFKGFEEQSKIDIYLDLLKDVKFGHYCVGDNGFDITAYFSVVKYINSEYFCFLNSHSKILDNDWLLKLYYHSKFKTTGIVGTTGNCESNYDNVNLPERKQFLPFPNYHIRTTGFMLKLYVIEQLTIPVINTKMDAYLFESGKNGLTRQIIDMGYKCLIVGKNGHSYEPKEWKNSFTFRRGNQENLLIGDNHTESYQNSDMDNRKKLTNISWRI